MCSHKPPCPAADATDREAAIVVVRHADQDWSVNCTFLMPPAGHGGTARRRDAGLPLPSSLPAGSGLLARPCRPSQQWRCLSPRDVTSPF
ncbi:DUF5999 family protein [Streptomyces sp. NBC_00829]|uniref:DUF5999 family protein n=1 Tax=Streptomyces sp. NBC_00829 TaxID=2903679 RepID=UPI002F910633|nr:DUF5999 family protein [Streptomyces sp. NBC_00829]